MKKIYVLFILLVSNVLFGQAFANYSDKVLVIVNEDVITQSEFDNRMKRVVSDIEGEANPAALEALPKQLLNSMISDRLQLQEAKRFKLAVSDEELSLAIQRFASQQGKSVEQLKAEIRANGEIYSVFEKTVKDSLTISRLNDYYTRSRVTVPDYEIDGFIAQNQMSADDAEYKIAHILIRNPESNTGLANDIVEKLKANEAVFEELAATYSESPDAQEGGVIGWRKLSQLPEVFAQALSKMSKGEISDVLTSANGLHILKLLETKGTITEIDQHKVQHILVSARTQVAKKQAIKKVKQIREKIIAGESFEQMARTYSDDSVSAANGGDLGWVSPGEMVEAFELAYTQLSIGDVSEAVESPYGVHLIKLNDQRKKNITQQILRARAESALRRQRSGREYQQWVRQLREKAYIQYIDEPSL